VTDEPPLPTLLSQLLIAFTIEFDNEAEHRLPHRTTRSGVSGHGRGPWLVSQAMWANFMQFVGDGVPLHEVSDLASLINLAGLERWRYGAGEIGALWRSLQSVTGQRGKGGPRLAEGLRPYPDGWRAARPYLRQTTAVLSDPQGALPRYPMVLHRGGWPDGS
jgi:hypothetical protein